MNSLSKAAMMLGAAGTGGMGAYYGIKTFKDSQISKIRDRINNRLLSTRGDANKSQWEDRLASLRKEAVKAETLTTELREIKTASSGKTWEDLRNWCAKRVGEKYSDKDSEYMEVISYCTFRNKDKLGGTLIKEDSVSTKWQKANETLKGKNDGLSEALAKVKEKLSAASGADNTALKTWCEAAYEIPWTNNDNPDFKDAKQYCLESGN
ncbi:hypothetical protein HF1_13970 [Mycoplasma haemofelis str. Langford 1]|uniref:Uncharacterized protein n=1 Tax=Mycoplasma haemofelis (strain Langford 1) TaxID=941640 RepID=E8ZJT4_MYCHL|nr:hypothetical protein [Mycoplasma haemofelis]CBY93405.1 hypothetical protein HF1_13970 [Mycoplasma haemofelis str. Langford 1]